jgi:hypothetical protein
MPCAPQHATSRRLPARTALRRTYAQRSRHSPPAVRPPCISTQRTESNRTEPPRRPTSWRSSRPAAWPAPTRRPLESAMRRRPACEGSLRWLGERPRGCVGAVPAHGTARLHAWAQARTCDRPLACDHASPARGGAGPLRFVTRRGLVPCAPAACTSRLRPRCNPGETCTGARSAARQRRGRPTRSHELPRRERIATTSCHRHAMSPLRPGGHWPWCGRCSRRPSCGCVTVACGRSPLTALPAALGGADIHQQ